jgi:hypothetical protein
MVQDSRIHTSLTEEDLKEYLEPVIEEVMKRMP